MNPDDKPLTAKQARQKIQQGVNDYFTGNDPGPIVFRLKPAKKASETYPLRLTQKQRETLLHWTRLNRGLKHKIQQAGEGTQIIRVTWNELDKLNEEIGSAAVYTPGTEKNRLIAVMRKVIKVFEKEYADVFDMESPRPRKRRLTKSGLLYQLKIKILDITPAIWRRIQVPDCTLTDLHEYIQAAFGWWDYHLHQFTIDGNRYGPPAPSDLIFDFGEETIDETDVLLSKLIPDSGVKSRWIYEYDFGDGWRHEVLFEGCPPLDSNVKYPLCLEGKRAGPPEDCGGPWGYFDYLHAISDPNHPRHEERLEWRGSFDPEAFDPKKATTQMRKVKS